MKRMIILFLIVTVEIVMVGCSGLDSPLNDTKAITAFNIATPYTTGVITEGTRTIAITVPYGTDVTSLTPTITYKGKSISPASGVAQDFTSPVTYTVTAANGSSQAYVVTVTMDKNPTKVITAFDITSPVTATGVIDETAHTIAITVPHNTDRTSLTPTITYTTGASISPASEVAQDFSNSETVPVTYTVTAADSSTREYKVTVTLALVTDKAITAFKFVSLAATGIITESSHTIAVTVPIGTDVTSLTPTITHIGSSIIPASGVAQNFTSPVTYTVTAADSSTQAYAVTVRPILPLVMISVPAGTFSRDGMFGNDSTVSAFQMSEKNITVNQFTKVTGLTNPSPSFTSVVDGPVQYVNWYHALVFCNKLSIREGLIPVYTINGSTDPAVWIAANEGAVPTASNADWDAATANWSATGYRLPTEMEWMWAAMGADTASPGNPNTTGYNKAFAGSTGSNAIGDYAWTSENSTATTHPVGTKLPNELGLYDMSGNVYEWCWDWRAGYPTGLQNNYRGAALGTQRIGHGGSWYFDASHATVAYRGHDVPLRQYDFIGFRVVRQP